MVEYENLLEELNCVAESDYAAFMSALAKDNRLQFLGVRIPVLRKISKRYIGKFELVRTFPDEYFEVTFVKLCVAAAMPYDEFINVSDYCVNIMYDWALCDGCAPECIKSNREKYLPYIEKYAVCRDGYEGGQYIRRFSLITLLHFYVKEEYLPLIFSCVSKIKNDDYYVTMGAGWLLAEVLVKYFDAGFSYLNSTMCDINIKFKAISKALDSFRVSAENKAKLRTLRAELRLQL